MICDTFEDVAQITLRIESTMQLYALYGRTHALAPTFFSVVLDRLQNPLHTDHLLPRAVAQCRLHQCAERIHAFASSDRRSFVSSAAILLAMRNHNQAMRFPEESLEWPGHDDFTICPNRALFLPQRPLTLLRRVTRDNNIQEPQIARLKINRSKPGTSIDTMHKPILVIFLFVLACAHSHAHAAAWQPSPGHVQVPIWPGAVPDALSNPKPESVGPGAGQKWWPRANDVSQPTMTLYAAKGRNTGVAVVVFPGGGYQFLAMDLEGTEICDWLTSRGITCVLLK